MPTYNTKLSILTEPVISGSVSSISKILKFDTKTRMERTYSLQASMGLVTVDIANVNNVKALIITTPISGTQFNVKFVGSTTFTHKCYDMFVFSPEPTFWATVTSISISTDTTTLVDINVQILGVATV